MASDGSNQEAIENTKQQIRGLVSEIAQLAKSELETGKSFDPELANPVYLKTPEYKKK